MVGCARTLSVLLGCLVASCVFSSQPVVANNSIQVGGRDGWVVNPSESYDHWAHRLRFQVNDSLVFKGSDSVLQVQKEEYNSCDASNPLKTMNTNSSGSFRFDRSGPFYFISGNKTNCLTGQKLVVVVLAVRTHKTPPSSSPALPPTTTSPFPSMAPQPPSASSPSPIPLTPSLPPQPSPASSPSPVSATPSLAPQPSAAASSPLPSSAPPESSPSSSPAPSESNSPAGAPDSSPEGAPAGQPGASPSSPPIGEDTTPGAADQLSPADSSSTTSPDSSSAWRGVAGIYPAFVVVGLAGLLTFVM